MVKTCCMSGCTNKNKCGDGQLHQFPSDLNLCRKWIENCGDHQLLMNLIYDGVKSLSKKAICSWHFNSNDFVDSELQRLKPDAVPTFSGRNFIKTESDDSTPINCCYVKKEVVDEENSFQLNEISTHLSILTACEDAEGTFTNSWNTTTEEQLQLGNFEGIADSFTANVKMEESVEDLLVVKKERRVRKVTKKRRTNKVYSSKRRKLIRQSMRVRRLMETDEEKAARRLKDKINFAYRRERESELQSQMRKYKMAVRAAVRRKKESAETTELRRRKNALRAAYRRSIETEEEKAARRLKNKIYVAEKRKREKEAESTIRKYTSAVRVRLRRSMESEEKAALRKQKSALRAAYRRSLETDEQREARKEKDRIRAAERRRRRAELKFINENATLVFKLNEHY